MSILADLKNLLSDRRCRIIALALMLVLIVAAFFVAVVPIAYENVRSADWDQSNYLKIALWLTHGGAMTDGNRYPLYPALLTPFAQRDIDFFTTSKLLSIGLGGLGLLLVFWVARFYVGDIGALVVVTLLMLNGEYRTAAGYVDVEVLLTPLFFAAWHTTCVVVQRITREESALEQLAIIAGILSGLSYLAKGTGLIFLALFGSVLFLFLGVRVLHIKAFWAFIAVFVLLALPLWIHNTVHYGVPTYNLNTSRYMWLNSWENSYTYDDAELPTFRTYWQTHTLSDALERLWNGLSLVSPRQWYSAVRPIILPEAPWAQWISIAIGLVVLGGVTYRAARNWLAYRSHYVLSVLGILAFLLLFAFYHPIGDNAARFIVPWAPVMYMAALWLFKPLFTTPKYAAVGTVVGMMLCLISVALTLLRYDGAVSQLISMRTHDRQSSVITVRLMQNILDRTQSGDRLILGPTHALPEWLAYDRDVRPIPQVRQNWPSFTTWLVERNVRLVVLDREVWNRRRPLLGVYWTLTEAGLMADSLPPGWKLVAPKVYPCDPCLYTFDSAPYLPEVTANLVYENQAVLGGYNLTPAILSAERAFTLTLHWRLQQDMNENIHVFTHILGADGALVAQHDGPLVDLLGIAEHDQYQVGTRIHDVHPLPPLPSGTYSVRVGLYRWATQIRLTATSTDFSLSSNYPELLRLHICE